MSFTSEEVARLAALARLQLTDDESKAFALQLSDILEFARQIQSVDTSTVAADESAAVAVSVHEMRDDAVAPSLSREAVLTQAPQADSASGLFKVPRVIS